MTATRYSLVLVAIVAAALLVPAAVFAEESPPSADGDVGDDRGVRAGGGSGGLDLEGRGNRSDDAGSSGSTQPETPEDVTYQPPEFWAYEPSWGTQPESGEPCIDLQYRADVKPDAPLAIEWEMQTLQMVSDPRLDGVTNSWCDAAAAEVMQAPNALANGFVRRLPLPTPDLGIDPGFALTGMPAYLVIGNQNGFTVNEELDGWGAMRVTFKPRSLEVDWGDGTVEQVTDGRTGARWNGPSAQQISHTYIDSDRDRSIEGNTVVTVTSTWDADWSVAGFAGTVTGMAIDGAFDLPVRGYRAVRVSPSG